MRDLGVRKPGSIVEIVFDTFDGGTGASITMTGLAVTDIEVYKDGSMTQRSDDAGYTLLDTDGIDIDGVTGIHGFTISLADNTVAGFWAAGSRYFVVVSTITVDGQTVSFLAATFRIGYPGSVLDTTIATLASQTSFTLTVGPAEDDALNGMWCVIHDVASAVQLGWAQVSDYTGSTLTVTLAAGTTFTAAATDNISIMGPVPLRPTTLGRTLDVSAGGEAGVDWANVGSPTTTVGLSGTTVKTATDVETDTADIQTRLPAALVDGRIDGNVGAISADATAADNLETAFDGGSYNAGGGGIVAASVTGAVGSMAAGGITAASFGAGAVDAAALATDAGQEIADRWTARNVAGGSDTGRTNKQVMYRLRNKVSIAGGTMTVTQVDDSTSEWTAAVTTAAGNPIDSVDPA